MKSKSEPKPLVMTVTKTATGWEAEITHFGSTLAKAHRKHRESAIHAARYAALGEVSGLVAALEILKP